MSRENKLALVVGFALILLVGILVSDYFSAAGSQEAADLLPVRDPLVDAASEDPDLLSFDAPGGRQLPISMSSATPRAAESVPTIRMPDLQSQPLVPQTVRDPAAAADPYGTFHTVRRGESLTTICLEHYGDETLVRALASHNGLGDPNLVRAGVRLRIPDRSALGGAPGDPARRAAPPAPPATRTYTISNGDVLSRLAARWLGSAGKWRVIYDLNRDRIKDPDRLDVGTEIRVPAGANL